ncbi:hypothetical protein [Halosimplex halobium]|uniref:hypothetical protein n=1 Tax=Halosimplex halobium TaxID=3396618 RepID=UPI003F54347F
MRDRGILTERDREIIPQDANNPRRPEIKSRIRKRMDRIEEDLEILEEHEPELAEEFRTRLCAGSEYVALMNVMDDVQKDLEAHRERVENDD